MVKILAIVLLVLTSAAPAAAEYPDRPVTLLGGYPAGGMVDVVSRALAEGMKKKFPKGVAVTPRPGGGGSVALAELVVAKPDGYNMILAPLSTLVIHPQLNDLPYKTPDDYTPIINVVSFYSLLAVKADAPWKSIQELVGAAKASPGKIRVGSPGEGTSSHLNFETFKRLSGVNMTHVPFSGWGESSPALLGGHVEALMAQPGEVKGLVEGGKMRVLMVSQTKRHPSFPDAPTAKELGYGTDTPSGAWFIVTVPKATPAPVVKYIHDAVKGAMEEPAFVSTIKQRVIDIDYRAGDALRADLWKEYKAHTEVLSGLGLIKKK